MEDNKSKSFVNGEVHGVCDCSEGKAIVLKEVGSDRETRIPIFEISECIEKYLNNSQCSCHTKTQCDEPSLFSFTSDVASLLGMAVREVKVDFNEERDIGALVIRSMDACHRESEPPKEMQIPVRVSMAAGMSLLGTGVPMYDENGDKVIVSRTVEKDVPKEGMKKFVVLEKEKGEKAEFRIWEMWECIEDYASNTLAAEPTPLCSLFDMIDSLGGAISLVRIPYRCQNAVIGMVVGDSNKDLQTSPGYATALAFYDGIDIQVNNELLEEPHVSD